jgi:hypothetical protein
MTPPVQKTKLRHYRVERTLELYSQVRDNMCGLFCGTIGSDGNSRRQTVNLFFGVDV